MAKIPGHVKGYLHKDLDTSTERVSAFGRAPHETQLAVLAELRSRVNDNSTNIEIAIGATAVSLVVLFVGPRQVLPVDAPLPVLAIVGVVLGVFLGVLLLPMYLAPMLRSGKQTSASVWLAAYEDELARRWLATGRRARQWRNARVTWDD
jgi:Mn2+/Fe2+ NRAMP family transporter